MNLYKEREETCDCEKETGSNSCDSRCDQFIDMFEKDFDFNNIQGNGEFFEKLSQKEQSNKVSSDKNSDNGDKEELKTPLNIDAENEDKASREVNSPVTDMKDDGFISNAIVRMKDHKAKCTKLHAKQIEINNIYPKQEVRTMLLG